MDIQRILDEQLTAVWDDYFASGLQSIYPANISTSSVDFSHVFQQYYPDDLWKQLTDWTLPIQHHHRSPKKRKLEAHLPSDPLPVSSKRQHIAACSHTPHDSMGQAIGTLPVLDNQNYNSPQIYATLGSTTTANYGDQQHLTAQEQYFNTIPSSQTRQPKSSPYNNGQQPFLPQEQMHTGDVGVFNENALYGIKKGNTNADIPQPATKDRMLPAVKSLFQDHTIEELTKGDPLGTTIDDYIHQHSIPSDLLTFICQHCYKGFKRYRSLYRHYKTVHHLSKSRSTKDLSLPLLRLAKYSCPICDELLLDKVGMVRHCFPCGIGEGTKLQKVSRCFELYMFWRSTIRKQSIYEDEKHVTSPNHTVTKRNMPKSWIVPQEKNDHQEFRWITIYLCEICDTVFTEKDSFQIHFYPRTSRGMKPGCFERYIKRFARYYERDTLGKSRNYQTATVTKIVETAPDDIDITNKHTTKSQNIVPNQINSHQQRGDFLLPTRLQDPQFSYLQSTAFDHIFQLLAGINDHAFTFCEENELGNLLLDIFSSSRNNNDTCSSTTAVNSTNLLAQLGVSQVSTISGQQSGVGGSEISSFQNLLQDETAAQLGVDEAFVEPVTGCHTGDNIVGNIIPNHASFDTAVQRPSFQKEQLPSTEIQPSAVQSQEWYKWIPWKHQEDTESYRIIPWKHDNHTRDQAEQQASQTSQLRTENNLSYLPPFSNTFKDATTAGNNEPVSPVQSSLKDKEAKEDGKGYFKCYVEGCTKRFGRRQDMHRHAFTHDDKNSRYIFFDCFKCGKKKRYTRRDKFKNHERKCKGIPPRKSNIK